VVVVEDNPDDAELLLRELRRGNYEPQAQIVDNPTALREVLSHGCWDIVISDWSLPTFDGLAAFRLMRELGLDLPFIIVSGTIGEEHAVEALKAGVHDFMSKGRFARLLPAIERELREAVVRQQKRAAEADLARQREETEKSERLLRSVLQSVPDGVVVVDTEGRVIVWSAGTDAIVRMPRTSLRIEEWPAHYGLFSPDRMTQLRGSDLAIARALQGEKTDRQEIFLRNAAVPKGKWLSVSGRPLRAADGTITGAVAVMRDVTKEKLAQEQLMISDRMASVGMLAAGVAHEINNPLAAALLNLELANEALASDAGGDPAERERDVRDSLADARSAVARVREIVNDLRIFARQEEDSAERADVREALESSLRMAFNEIRHRARVVRDYGPVPIIRGSEARLGQVFLNLIVNAAQAIPEGKIHENVIRVATRTDAEGRAVIEVTDSGVGIRPEDLPNLFTPFFTTKPPGIGTGLGLAICQRIIAQMGGAIEVQSELGKGTTFRVILPPSDPPEEPARRAATVSTPRAPRRGRILVVDDEPMLAAAICRVLASQHDVVTTTRAEDALERLRSGGTFDVIFSDLMMPQVTGMELYARIAAEFPDHAQRVVFLTGGAFTQAAREFLAQTKNATLQKPIDRNSLLALVSERMKDFSAPHPA
jgi:PAS domain S-box-containing protein